MDAVSQVITLRSRGDDSLQSVLGVSLLVHVALVAAVFLAPTHWLGSVAEPEPVVMTISLGGPVGPRDGGLTTMGGRPIQALSEAKRAIEPVRPPAAREPEMVEPKKAAPKRAESKVPDTAKTPRGRTPTRGEEVRQGSAVSAERTARGQGFGLSSGGGGTGSYLDTANFCCPDYIALMLETIRERWDYRAAEGRGTALVKYTIQRDGRITDVQIERSSGYPTLDFIALRALQATRSLPPLPQAFTEPSLTVHLVFEYSQ